MSKKSQTADLADEYVSIEMEKILVPDGVSIEEAATRVTHMGIGAHQDDLEIFAYHGIAACYRSDCNWFAGVTVTDGGGSARVGPYADFSDEQMKAVRVDEQNSAARLGEYSFQAQLGYPSSSVKDPEMSRPLVDELESLLRLSRPRTLYLHNPADKHDTHIAVLHRCIEALRRLSPDERPEEVYGCEVWRDLDWVLDERKVALPVDQHESLATDLIALFESQVVGGKDYVSATLGRRRANATYFNSHAVDTSKAYTFALDLKPLIAENPPSLREFVAEHIDAFKRDCEERIQNLDSKR